MARPTNHIFDIANLAGKLVRIGAPELPGGRNFHYRMIGRGVYKAIKIGGSTYIVGDSVVSAIANAAAPDVATAPAPKPAPIRRGPGRPRNTSPAATAESAAQ